MSNTNEKIKAIFPHIVVGDRADKPYYSIYWYDVEKKTAYLGYSSYNLEIVHKWLQEEFEVVESDIDNLIKSQETEIERLQNSGIRASSVEDWLDYCNGLKSEAIKEFAERLKKLMHNKFKDLDAYEFEYVTENDIDNLVKELVGEGK